MTPGLASRTRSKKENLDGCCKVSFQKHASVVSRAAVNKSSRYCLCTPTTLPNNVESGRSFSSLIAPSCWKSTWTCSLVTSTELLGAYQMVTTLHPVVGPKEQYQVNELTFVASIQPLDSCERWKAHLHGACTIAPRDLRPPPKRPKLPS